MQTKLKQSKSMRLAYYGIQIIPCDIDQFNNLKYIDLSSNCLKKLPKEIFNLVNINTLLIECNKLKTLPKEIFTLTNLKLIALNGNYYPDTCSTFPYMRLDSLRSQGYIV